MTGINFDLYCCSGQTSFITITNDYVVLAHTRTIPAEDHTGSTQQFNR